MVVGAAAALTHMVVFHVCETLLMPELANALGFAVAFCISFTGHRFLSFQDAQTPLLQSLKRFAITAIAGFATNELMFVCLFRFFELPSLVALFLALVFASSQTFVLSRFWAFKKHAH